MLNRLRPLPRFDATFPPDIKGKTATTVRFYRIRSNVNPLLGSTITRSKVIASTLLMSTILRSTQNDLHQNCFYIINVYRS